MITNSKYEIDLELMNQVNKYYYRDFVSLIAHYARKKKYDLAIKLLIFRSIGTRDLDEKAGCYMMLGQIHEQRGDYHAALRYYLKGMEYNVDRKDDSMSYYFYNNAGFCSNKVGKYNEGSIYCKKAIEIKDSLPNAHKNLGISLEGLGDYIPAAKEYIRATKINVSDKRAFYHLMNLIKEHPFLKNKLKSSIDDCLILIDAKDSFIGIDDIANV